VRVRTILLAFLSVCGLVAAPEARACAYCFSATDSQRTAYYGTTLLLVLLPLLLLAVLLGWIRRAAVRDSGRGDLGVIGEAEPHARAPSHEVRNG